jgi:hypothetical protein
MMSRRSYVLARHFGYALRDREKSGRGDAGHESQIGVSLHWQIGWG